MVKESLPEVYILILMVFNSAFIAFGGRVLRVLCWKWRLWALLIAVRKNERPWSVLPGWQRVATVRKRSHEKFFGGENISNRSHHHINNPARQRRTSPHRYRRHRRRLALGIPARGGKSIYRDHGAPIDSGVAAEQESCPATNATTTTTAANAAAVIAAIAVKAAVTVDAPATTSLHAISTPGFSPITSTATATPTVVAAIATPEGDLADTGRRKKDMFRRHQALRVRQLGKSGAIVGEGGRRSGE